MRPAYCLAACVALLGGALTIQSALAGTPVTPYSVEITLRERTEKSEKIVLKKEVYAGNSVKLRGEIRHRPFVTGFVDATKNDPTIRPLIQIVETGPEAEVKISETVTDALLLDATIEFTDVAEVKSKAYPGREEQVQTVRVATTKTRLMETIAPNEELKSTLQLDGRTYDVTLSIVRKQAE